MFVGYHELSLDEKNRVSVPSAIRSYLGGDAERVRFYLVPGERDRSLELFTEDYFPQHMDNLHARMGNSQARQDFETFFLSVSSLLEVDKQGRVLLPQQQLKSAGIGKHIMLLAAKDRLIMLNREDGQKFIDDGWRQYRLLKKLAETTSDHNWGMNGNARDVSPQ